MSEPWDMTIKLVSPNCQRRWTTKLRDGLELEHWCMLKEGHEGECVCFECEDFPLELHGYIGEDGKSVSPYEELMDEAQKEGA